MYLRSRPRTSIGSHGPTYFPDRSDPETARAGTNAATMQRARFATLLAASVTALPFAGCTRDDDSQPAGEASSFTQALAEVAGVVAADTADASVSVPGRTRFFGHGRKTARAVLIFHGFTNCPQQFDEFARRLHARGCNVYVPRIPHHGKKNRLTTDLANQRVDELVAFADRSYAIARELGDELSVVGLSLGGTLSTYLAQTKPVDVVVPVAPFLQPFGYSRRKGDAVMRVAQALPDAYWWWDIRLLEGTKPDYAYPGYPSHALAQIVFLGDTVFAAAANAKPLARRCVMVSNAGDNGIDNAVSRELLGSWQRSGAAYEGFTFSDLGPPRHDIIDPTTFSAARTLVYPKLERLAMGS